MKTKYSSQTAAKSSWKTAILLTIIALALCASPGGRAAQQCRQDIPTAWVYSGTGSWFSSSNWCDGVPICLAFTCISNGGTAQINSTDPIANACETFVGQNNCAGPSCSGGTGQSGNLSVDGGTLNTCNELHVGYQGTGVLKIMNGGVVNATDGVDIAVGAGSNGAATVDGTNSLWTVSGSPPLGELGVGGILNVAGGTGLLTVTNGGKVTAATVHVYKSGTLTGNGTANTTDTGGTTVEGTLAPRGTLTIDGNLTFPNPNANMSCNVSSTSVDNAQVSGTAALNGKLSVRLNGFFTGDFTLLHASTLRNQFSSYSFTYTGCLAPSIRYTNTDVILHVESTCQ